MDASYLDLMMAQQEESFEAAGEAEGGGGVWVVAPVVEDELAPVTLEAMGAARTLADTLGAYVYAILLGDRATPLAETLYHAGADGVRVALLDIDHRTLVLTAGEPCLDILADLFEEVQPEMVLLGATDLGQALAPRLAQRMGGGLIEHVTAVRLEETTRSVEATYPVYDAEYFEVGTCPAARPQFLTVEPGAFSAPFLDEYRKGEPTIVEGEPAGQAMRVVGPAEEFEPPRVPLSEASMIVSVGRQVGDLDNAEELARNIGAQVAGDRGAWDAGFIEAEQLVDVRGTTVSPEVYVAVGIRGDTFHNAAMEGSKFIVAVHPEPSAPIFDVADLCVEAEPERVLPAILEALT